MIWSCGLFKHCSICNKNIFSKILTVLNISTHSSSVLSGRCEIRCISNLLIHFLLIVSTSKGKIKKKKRNEWLSEANHLRLPATRNIRLTLHFSLLLWHSLNLAWLNSYFKWFILQRFLSVNWRKHCRIWASYSAPVPWPRRYTELPALTDHAWELIRLFLTLNYRKVWCIYNTACDAIKWLINLFYSWKVHIRPLVCYWQ